MKTNISQFKGIASLPMQAIALIFDLEGFSKFFSQPDVQEYVPKYLNLVLEAIAVCFEGGDAYWDGRPGERDVAALIPPIHSKFLGDGALYIFDYHAFSSKHKTNFCNNLWNLKTYFNALVERATEEIPILDIPKKIRIGVAAGTVYKLSYAHQNREEYIGYCINLASRLQSYCREIGFIASGRLNLPSQAAKDHRYSKVVATSIKGFPQEIVLVDGEDYAVLDEKIRSDLFTEL